MTDAAADFVASVRTANVERIKAQHQIAVLAGAVAAASASFGSDKLREQPELLAVLSLLFVGFWLALLRQELDISFDLHFLVATCALGDHQRIQAEYEAFRYNAMRGTPAQEAVSVFTTVGLYGLPVLGSAFYGVSALLLKPSTLDFVLLGVALVFFIVALLISRHSVLLYFEVGETAVKQLSVPTSTGVGGGARSVNPPPVA